MTRMPCWTECLTGGSNWEAALPEALCSNSICNLLADDAITADGFTHVYQTANFTVGECLQRAARLDEMLATLAGKLNSNESFNPDRGFQVDVVFVSMPGPGSGRGRKCNPGRRCLDRENK